MNQHLHHQTFPKDLGDPTQPLRHLRPLGSLASYCTRTSNHLGCRSNFWWSWTCGPSPWKNLGLLWRACGGSRNCRSLVLEVLHAFAGGGSLVTAIFGRLWPQFVVACDRINCYGVTFRGRRNIRSCWNVTSLGRQAHYLVMLEGQFLWQAQHLVKFG